MQQSKEIVANASGLHDDLFAQDVVDDPYSYFGRMRETDPVHWNQTHQLWLITRYDDVVWVCSHPERFSNMVFQCDPNGPYPAVDAADHDLYDWVKSFFSNWLFQFDPPQHSEMRKPLVRFFGSNAMEAWRPTVQAITENLVDIVETKGEMDLVSEFATPMPLLTITRMLGLPVEDCENIQEELGPALLYMSRGETDRMRVLADGIIQLQQYFERAVAERAKRPSDDILSALLVGEKSGAYTREQVVANAILLLVAGYDTTSSLISNGMLAFIEHPKQWELFKQDPIKAGRAATNECLRYDSPQKTVQRIASEDVELCGRLIRRLQRLRIVFSSANRDPRKFSAPDSFDISRSQNAQLAFGYGIHHCIGASLARLQAQEAFKALAMRFPSLYLKDNNLSYQPSISFRSMKRMHVTWDHR